MLNPEQQAAVEYLEGPLLVLAGPGTGKTQLLSAKVAHILSVTDANPENILCLTFTEAGAENMRDRLTSMIGPAAANVTISTYHAFGRNLLDRYNNYAESSERRLENPIDPTLQHKIVAEILEALPARDILGTASVADIQKTIANAKSARLSAADIKKIAEQNLSDSDAISAELSPLFQVLKTNYRDSSTYLPPYEEVLSILTSYISPDPITGNIERIANHLARELKDALAEAETLEKPNPLTSWRNRRFEKTKDGGYRLKDHIANKKLLSFAGVMKTYDERLEKDGLFDFSDMIELAIRFLKEDRGFKLSLSELFQYILLDEFQDTNTSQFELIKLLTDYESPVVMAVGDDDQAIYEFQGANASNLLEFQNHYQAKIISLVKNYRSGADILSLSRGIADQIGDSFVKKHDNVEKVLTAMVKEQPCEITRHEFPCSDAENYWVGLEIRHLLDSGVSGSDIAVIAPQHQSLVNILPYLKHFDIDITYEKRENLLKDPIIHGLITFSRFIYELASGHDPRELLPEVLALEFLEFDAVDVVKLFPDRHNRTHTLDILASAPEGFTKFREFVSLLAAKSLTTPYDLWQSFLVGTAPIGELTSPFLSYYQAHLPQSELLELYENLATLRLTTTNYLSNITAEKKTLLLADFITMVNDYEKAGTDITRVNNFRDSDNAVQVMTAHKSKGLEFPHVFLIDINDHTWGKGKGNNNFLSLPLNVIQIRHTGVTDDEHLRLLFVAMTRAKLSLTMTGSRANSDGKHLARLSYLNESSAEEATPHSPFLPESTRDIILHSDDLSDAEKIVAVNLSWNAKYFSPTADVMSIYRERIAGYRLSATDLTSFIDLRFAGPQALATRLLLHAPDSPISFQQYYGILIHQIFEKVTSEKLDDTAATKLYETLAKDAPFDTDEKQELLSIGLENLGIALAEFGDTLRRDNTRAEVNLSPEHLVFDGVPLSGKIDHIYINEADKTIEVVDYKTAKYRDKGWDSHDSLYKYRLQLEFYKLLLNLSPTYSKYKVTSGHIFFVTPDSDGKVYDKTYDFDGEEKELKSLIKAVYHEITSLDLINNPAINIPADPNNDIYDIKRFVKSLLESEG